MHKSCAASLLEDCKDDDADNDCGAGERMEQPAREVAQRGPSRAGGVGKVSGSATAGEPLSTL